MKGRRSQKSVPVVAGGALLMALVLVAMVSVTKLAKQFQGGEQDDGGAAGGLSRRRLKKSSAPSCYFNGTHSGASAASLEFECVGAYDATASSHFLSTDIRYGAECSCQVMDSCTTKGAYFFEKKADTAENQYQLEPYV